VPLVTDEIPAEILGSEELERKVYTTYSSKSDYTQFLDYKSQGDTRLTINGSRHYRSPFGALPSVTTILSATSGNKAALERWAAKNPGGREAAAARGTKVHSLMEEYLLGINRDPVIEDEEIADFWSGLPENLSKLGRVIWAENPVGDAFPWCKGSDGISRVWHPGVKEGETWGWAGAPDIVAEYKNKVVLGDLKTSVGKFFARWPGPDTPKNEYAMRRSGFLKYQKCLMQLGAYAMGLEHTVGIVPDIFMIFVATRERNKSQVFAVQGGTIEKYKQKWLDAVNKYYSEVLPAQQAEAMDFEVVDGDQNKDQ
jgi:hypothetical protein